MHKNQNTRRKLSENIRTLFAHGMNVTAGLIVGNDGDPDTLAKDLCTFIDETPIPHTLIGLLFALPNTALSDRLKKEGRLYPHYDRFPELLTCSSVAGINFRTQRPTQAVFADFANVLRHTYSPKNYFRRVIQFIRLVRCEKSPSSMPAGKPWPLAKALLRLFLYVGLNPNCGIYFWRVLFYCLVQNPRSLRHVLGMLANFPHYQRYQKSALHQMELREKAIHVPKIALLVPAPS